MSKQYYTTIGLEIHAELKTQSKMFCDCINDSDEKNPNTNICPICLAHPGTLPVINKKAVENVIKVGLALGAEIADFTEFDRKNYFYPDIPKAYQITQYKFPIVSGGELNGIKITRVHLEEDTATSKHHKNGSSNKSGYSLVDFNRSGIPLMELVTEPVIHSSKEAGDFGRELQILLRYLEVSEANMEKGQMRVELNISISDDLKEMGTKVEVKNINSFRAMERAAEYEIKRMTNLLEQGKGKEIVQETRGWDEVKQSTFSQRSKENANDYRYFPDPDLPKLYLSKIFDIEKMRNELPELPKDKRTRYKKDYGIKDEDIESYIINQELATYFEKIASSLLPNKELVQISSNFISNDLIGSGRKVNDFIKPNSFIDVIKMVFDKELSSRAAKDIINTDMKLFGNGQTIREYAVSKNLIQNHDKSKLKKIVQKTIQENPEIVKIYEAGKENVIMSLVGKIMKETKGSADPMLIQKLLKELLS